MRVVVKFGGTSVKDLERVKTAARNLVKLKNSGTEIAVVVSAPGKMTNKLIQKGAIFSRNGLFSQDYLNLLSLGEKQSTYLMSMALNSLNVQSRSFTLDSPEWPLISEPSLNSEVAMSSGKENDLIDIRIDEEETTGRFRKFIEPVLRDGQIPVISGFFIRDASGKIVTLGRGGSDITAFLVGKYLKADEVIIVTDVSGVYSGDPRYIKNVCQFKNISADDLAILSSSGAQVIHPNALRFKSKETTARIVHFKEFDKISVLGTTIYGAAETGIAATEFPLTMLTFMGENISRTKGLLASVGNFLQDKGISIHSLTASDTFVAIYLSQETGDSIYQELHENFVVRNPVFKGLTKVSGIGELVLSNHLFIEACGVISMVSETLSRNGISIIEMVTSHTDIVVYCKYPLINRCVELLKERLGVKGN